ncbi:MAG: DUF177 domain-containing protein [Erythrobacter sp.]
MVNTPETSELSRPIRIKGLPGEPVIIEADAGERAALADRFGLPGIDRLQAEVSLDQRGAAIRATGSLVAAIRQACAVSGEEFPARFEEDIDLRFVPEGTLDAEETEEVEIELEADDCDEIEYSGDAFDLGEAVAQTLGLAIDPFAEGPDADKARKQAGILGEGETEGPLAAGLAALQKG